MINSIKLPVAGAAPLFCRFMAVLIFGMALLPLCFVHPVQAADARNFDALFPIGIEHGFPEPEETFFEVKDLILRNYYTDAINDDALYWAAIRGMLRHISPPESPELCKIWTADEYEQIVTAVKGNQVSIGIKSTFNPKDGSLTVTEVLPQSPSTGVLQPLDRILRIDDTALKGKTLEEINRLLSGGEGERIKLTVNRDIDIFEVTLTRRQFRQQNVIVTDLTATVAMVEIKRFTAGVADRLKTAAKQIGSEGFKALIIDLRGNPGGMFIEALKTAELFLPKGHILMRALTRDNGLQNYVSANTEPFSFDIAVLINRKTASSAEILAASLQEQKKATLIGTLTFGKGIFEKSFPLKNKMAVKFITGALYSPKGNTWHGKGIVPDFLVQQEDKTLEALLKLDPKQRAGKDPAIITALKLLKRSGI